MAVTSPQKKGEFMIWEHDYRYWDARDFNDDPYDAYDPFWVPEEEQTECDAQEEYYG